MYLHGEIFIFQIGLIQKINNTTKILQARGTSSHQKGKSHKDFNLFLPLMRHKQDATSMHIYFLRYS